MPSLPLGESGYDAGRVGGAFDRNPVGFGPLQDCEHGGLCHVVCPGVVDSGLHGLRCDDATGKGPIGGGGVCEHGSYPLGLMLR
jgi:hypothetical protein